MSIDKEKQDIGQEREADQQDQPADRAKNENPVNNAADADADEILEARERGGIAVPAASEPADDEAGENGEEDVMVEEEAGMVQEAGAGDSDSDNDSDEEVPVAAKPKVKRKRRPGNEPVVQKPVRIIHLVFDAAGGEQIRQSFELAPEHTGEILYIEDNYSLGPVADLGAAEGWQARKQWWQSVLELPEEDQPEVMTSDKMKLHQLLQQLDQAEDAAEDTVLWIWMGQNERDVAGYYYLISQLMDFQGRIQVLYLNNLPFIDEKGHIFYPRQLAEILPREFVKAARLARVVTLSEFELDPEEWDKLSRQSGAVRLLEGGKKLSVKENDYYDKIILDQLGTATMKLSKLLHLLATKARLGLPEYYIIWRVKSLIELGQVISQGDVARGAKNVSLKATQGQMFVELSPDELAEEGDETADA